MGDVEMQYKGAVDNQRRPLSVHRSISAHIGVYGMGILDPIGGIHPAYSTVGRQGHQANEKHEVVGGVRAMERADRAE